MSNEHNNAPAVPLGYVNAGHLHEMQSGRLPYAYLYAAPGVGVEIPVYTSNAPAVPQDLIDKAKRAVKNLADEAQANGSSETWVSAQERLILSVIDAATPAPAPAQEVGLTDEEIDTIASKYISMVGDHWCNEEAIRERHAEDFARAIIAALRAKGVV